MSLIHGGFQDLPSELIRQILNFLQNKDSLYSTTTSCKRLWQTFKEYESSICYNVALNFCGRPEYLHEALAVIEAGRVPREEWTELEMRRFMDKVGILFQCRNHEFYQDDPLKKVNADVLLVHIVWPGLFLPSKVEWKDTSFSWGTL